MIAQRLQEFLDQHNAMYTHKTHRLTYTSKDLAQADHVPPWEVAKTVVVVADGVFALAVVPANAMVDLEALRRALGIRSVRLASEKEIAALFPDVELGAMAPFGNLYGNVPVYVDRALASEEEVVFNAGTHRDVIHMKYRDFAHFVHPEVMSFAFPG